MLIVLSPAKTLDYASPLATGDFTMPDFTSHAAALIKRLKRLSPAEIAQLMKISDPLAALNAGRYASWTPQCTSDNARAAVLAFNGDVYAGLEAATLPAPALSHLQSQVRILSGLYGLLRPLDLMQPYRLEMGTRLKNARGANLYEYWGRLVTDTLARELVHRNQAALVNLASEEYFKVVQPERLRAPVITPVFQDWKDGRYKIISFHAKKARGMMARYAAINAVTEAGQLKNFDLGGYAYDAANSDGSRWMFRRRMA
jgi:cytoplasmic iron level regulating protein YaaA (DUF328/UPF0246 family)